MREVVYHKMAEVEGAHWWFVGRRAIVSDILDRLALPRDAHILEIGCGSGGNFDMLCSRGSLCAVDNEETALDYARQKRLAEVKSGKLPDQIPYHDGSFDLIVLLDVLEHVEEDEESLRIIHRLLKPRGRILATAPALRFLWSAHDEFHHHMRRYTRRELHDKAVSAGFRLRKLSYFNTMLFPLIALIRFGERFLPRQAEKDLEIPPAALNRFLTSLFSSERHLLRSGSFPFGVSLLLVGEKHA